MLHQKEGVYRVPWSNDRRSVQTQSIFNVRLRQRFYTLANTIISMGCLALTIFGARIQTAYESEGPRLRLVKGGLCKHKPDSDEVNSSLATAQIAAPLLSASLLLKPLNIIAPSDNGTGKLALRLGLSIIIGLANCIKIH